jgi:Ca2+-binding RTX toxin-like protein
MRKTVLLLAALAIALLLVSGVAWAVTKDCRAGADFCVGTNERDTLNGSEERDKIYGKAANDKLFGNGGNDNLLGGEDNDTIRGGAGEDNVSGHTQDGDEIYGQAGADHLEDDSWRCGNRCVDDDNLLDGGSGPDWLYGDSKPCGGLGDDDLDGAYAFGGKRLIRGGPGEDRITSAGKAVDTIYVQDGVRDTVACGPEEDTVYFDKGVDSVNPVTCEKRISEPQ